MESAQGLQLEQASHNNSVEGTIDFGPEQNVTAHTVAAHKT
jgi:hypothetical protein